MNITKYFLLPVLLPMTIVFILSCNPKLKKQKTKLVETVLSEKRTIYFLFQKPHQNDSDYDLTKEKTFELLHSLKEFKINIDSLDITNIDSTSFKSTVIEKMDTLHRYFFIFMLSKKNVLAYSRAEDISLCSDGYNFQNFKKNMVNSECNKNWKSIICVQNGAYELKCDSATIERLLSFPGDNDKLPNQTKCNIDLLFDSLNQKITVINSLGLGYIKYPQKRENLFIRGIVLAIRSSKKYDDYFTLLTNAQTRHNYYYLNTRLYNTQLAKLPNDERELNDVKKMITRIFTFSKTIRQEPIPFGILFNDEGNFVELNKINISIELTQKELDRSLSMLLAENSTQKDKDYFKFLVYSNSKDTISCKIIFTDKTNNEVVNFKNVNSFIKYSDKFKTDYHKILDNPDTYTSNTKVIYCNVVRLKYDGNNLICINIDKIANPKK
jgi:hypothetical protein